MMHNDEIPKVFISSTHEDLRTYRDAAAEVANREYFLPVISENFSAVTAPPLDECLKKVTECDLLVVIVAYRYGWIPPGQPE